MKLPCCLTPMFDQLNWIQWDWRKGAKVPVVVGGHQYASTTDPRTWAAYDEVKHYDRIGFVIAGSGIGALDLDDCRNQDTGVLSPWARKLIAQAKSYVEITPSGCGLRIIGTARGGPVHCAVRMEHGKVEVYRDCARYITVTGNELGHCTRLANIDALIDQLAPPRRAVGANARKASKDSMRAIIKKHRIGGWLRAELLGPGQHATERRHLMHFKLACALHEIGVPAPEAFVLLRETKWNKHNNEKPVWDLINKVWS